MYIYSINLQTVHYDEAVPGAVSTMSEVQTKPDCSGQTLPLHWSSVEPVDWTSLRIHSAHHVQQFRANFIALSGCVNFFNKIDHTFPF